MVTVDAVVFAVTEGSAKVLLIRRGKAPFKGQWALPGGFVDMEEELADAAARELAEETGLEGVKLEQMRTFGTVGRDPRGRQITVVYMGIIEDERAGIRGGDDAAGARWFGIEELPAEMAFDHRQVVETAKRRLRRRKVYREKVSGRG
jgi:8-oxo-dGTP diphosphatase